MDKKISITVDATLLATLTENFPDIHPADYIRTLVELHAVEELGEQSPARYGVGALEFIRCAHIALEDGEPIERIIAPRKARIARAVRDAYGKSAQERRLDFSGD